MDIHWSKVLVPSGSQVRHFLCPKKHFTFNTRTCERFPEHHCLSSAAPAEWFLCLYFYCLSLHSLSLVIVCPVGFWMGSIWKNFSVFVLRLSSESGTFGDLSTWPPYVAPQYHQHYSVMGKIGLAKNLLHDLICICLAKYEKM